MLSMATVNLKCHLKGMKYISMANIATDDKRLNINAWVVSLL